MIILLLIFLLVLLTIFEFAIISLLANIVDFISIGILGTIVSLIAYCCFWSIYNKDFRNNMINGYKEIDEYISNHVSKKTQILTGVILVAIASIVMTFIAYSNLSLKGQAINYYEEQIHEDGDIEYETLYEGDDIIIMLAKFQTDVAGLEGAKNIIVYCNDKDNSFNFISYDGDKDWEVIVDKVIETSKQKYDESQLRNDLKKLSQRRQD